VNIFGQFVHRLLNPPEKRIAITFDNFPDGIGTGTSSSWRFADYVKYGYKRNPVVYACLREICTASKSVKFVIKRDGEIIPDDKIPKDLAGIQRLITSPSQTETMRSFIEMWCLHMNLAGCAFAQLRGFGTRVGLNGLEFKSAPEMVLLLPDKVRIITDDFGAITRYEYGPTGIIIPAEEIVYTRYPDPQSMTGAFSPIAAAAEVIEAHTNAISWNRNILQRGGIPAIIFFVKGLLSLKPTLKKELHDDYQAQYAGAKNAGRPMFVPGESIEAKEMSQTAKDMDWLLGKQDMMRDICAVMGVDSKLIGDPAASTYNNVNEARKGLYLETVIPPLQAFADALTNKVASQKPGIEIGLEYGHIDVMQEDATALFTRLAMASWLTENEKRVKSGFDTVPEGDVILVPFNLVPLGTDVTADTGAVFGKSGYEKREDSEPVLSLFPIHPKSRYKTEVARAAAYNRKNKMRLPYETKFERAFKTFAREQLNTVFDKLEGMMSAADNREMHAMTVDRLFQNTNQDEAYVEAVHSLTSSLMVTFGQAALAELKAKGIVFDINRPAIQKWIAETLADRSELINQTTADRMQRIINEGVSQNESIMEIKQRLLDNFDDLTPARARTIAQTEVGMASSKATLEGYRQSGVAERKEWLSARDSRVRDSHVELDGMVVSFDEDFVSPMDGVRGQAPGMMGDPSHDCNCRCTFSVLDETEEPI